MSLEEPTISDDDMDDLPDLRDLFPAAFEEKKCSDIKDGDIVWAKYKNLYWPAFVKKVYKKRSRVSIWFTDQPETPFNRSLYSVVPFSNIEKIEEFEKLAIEAGCFEAFDGLKSHASRYITRKLEGYQDDPQRYFDQTHPYFLVEDYLKNNPDADKESLRKMKMPPLYIDHTPSVAKSPVKETEIGVLSNDLNIQQVSDSESVDEDLTGDINDGESTRTSSILSKKFLFSSDGLDDEPNEKYVQEIIACILSGKVDEYLRSIFHKEIPSFYFDFYEKCTTNVDKQKLNYISYGPVENLDYLREIIIYLTTLYENTTSAVKKKFSRTLYSPLINASFVSSVWLPESIICAMASVKKMSYSNASEEFHRSSTRLLKAYYIKYVEKNELGKSVTRRKSARLSETASAAISNKVNDTSSAKDMTK